MAFLKTGLGTDYATQIRGDGVWLRAPQMGDYGPWAELRAASRGHLTGWEPQWARDELTRSAYRRRMRHYAREQRDDTGYAFFIFRAGDDALLGGLTISNVRRGVSQSAALGYWLGLPYVQRGHMTRAVRAAVSYAFSDLRLHRVEAACLPVNDASMRVLDHNGFTREGLARRYLKINGVWQDHVLFAKLIDDPRDDVPAAQLGAQS